MQAAQQQALPGPAVSTVSTWTVVALLTLVGVVLRMIVASQPLFADELSTYWIVTHHSIGGVVSTVHSDAEITPPLLFVLSWLTSQIGDAPEYLRAPSLAAGAATVPLVYLVGLRLVGRSAALIATALTALAPFMIFYSAEARGYALLMAFTLLSTLAMLIALKDGRARWWAVYAGASCAAAYSHYTCLFLLGAQFVWLLWAHPGARKAATLANAGAAVAFLPWLTGLQSDLASPTVDILSSLSPFSAREVRIAVQHWSVGHPLDGVPLSQLPGTVPLVALAVAISVAVAALVRQLLSEPAEALRNRFSRVDKRVVLVVMLALAAPVGEGVASAVGSNIWSTRNLASSWPPLALAVGALLAAPERRLRFVTAGLVIACFAVGAARMLTEENQRPDYEAATDFVERTASGADVVIDATGVSTPGPLTALDATFSGARPVFRAGVPAQRDHPFNVFDSIVTRKDALEKAVAAANGGRIFVVGTRFPEVAAFAQRQRALRDDGRRAGYEVVDRRRFAGFVQAYVETFERRSVP